MPVQQKQNIKGFSLIELLVIVAIISIIAAIGFPDFMKWQRDRELRAQQEKIANLFTTATTQVERGAYPYVRIEFVKGTSPAQITVKGIGRNTLSKKINSKNDPTCSVTDFTQTATYQVDDITSHTLNAKTHIPTLAPSPSSGAVSVGSGGAICFSKGSKYFNQVGAADKQGNIIFDKSTGAPKNYYVTVCHVNDNKCSAVTGNFSDNYPAYLIRYSRFGLITKYKWNSKLLPAADWTSQ
mgnify:CR=1 FL=1